MDGEDRSGIMKTVKDLIEYQRKQEQDKNEIIDEWLEEGVFPTFSYNGQGFRKPADMLLKDVEKLLEIRGFSVRTCSSYQGSYVYITIPPQGTPETAQELT